MIKGTVLDGAKKPLDKAGIVIEFKDGINRKDEVKTNKKGEFIQIGLAPGNYKVTASFEGLGEQSFDARVRLGDAAEVNFLLGGGGGMNKEDAAKADTLKKTFDEGVTLSKAGSFDEAIAKFTEATALVPDCADDIRHDNIGFAMMQKKDFDKAEVAFNKAIELKANYVDAYNGLATVYNSQKRYDKAQQMGEKAAELSASVGGTAGGVDAEYNQGVILWNAGKDPRRQAALRESHLHEAGSRRRALPAGDGESERREDGGSDSSCSKNTRPCTWMACTPPRRRASWRSSRSRHRDGVS